MARFGQPLYPGGLNAQIQSALRVLVPEQGACCWKFARRGESTHNCGLCSAPVKILERRHELIESLRISHVEPLSNEPYRLFSLIVPGVLFRISSLHVLDKKKEKTWPSQTVIFLQDAIKSLGIMAPSASLLASVPSYEPCLGVAARCSHQHPTHT